VRTAQELGKDKNNLFLSVPPNPLFNITTSVKEETFKRSIQFLPTETVKGECGVEVKYIDKQHNKLFY
jgi:hypothetical protein